MKADSKAKNGQLLKKAVIIGIFLLSAAAVLGSIVQIELYHTKSESGGIENAKSTVDQSEKEHIWIVMFDSMTYRFFGSGRIPFIESLTSRGVSGSETPCTDALTVPCLKAAFTGKDRFSVFALFEDFISTGQKTRGSVFDALSERGYKIGTVATYSWAQFEHSFSSKVLHGMTIEEGYTDYTAVEKSIRIMQQDNPDVMVTALRYFDNVSHKYKPGSKEYYEEALRSDDCVRKIHDALPAGWNLLVFGDHGHDPKDGRHLVGLDIPAGYVYTGPAFREGVQKDIDIKDHFYVLATLFDLPLKHGLPDEDLLQVFDPEWLQSHASRAVRQDGALQSKAGPEPASGGSWPFEALFLLLFTVLCAAAASAASWKISWRRAIIPALAVMLIMCLEGYAYIWLRTHIYQQSWLIDYLVWLIEFALAYAAARMILRRSSFHSHLLWACLLYFGITLIIHLPTIYNFGHARSIIHGILNTTVCLGAVLLARRKQGEAFPYGRALLLLAAVFVLAGLNIDMRVENFNFRYFYWSHFLLGPVPPSIAFVLVSGLLVAFVFERQKQGIAAFLLLQGFALVSNYFPPLVYTLPAAASFVLFLPDRLKPAMLRKVHTGWHVTFALITLIYFLDFSFVQVTELTVLLLIGALLLKTLGMVADSRDKNIDAGIPTYLAAASALVLGLFSLWITCGMGMSGVLFQPMIAWFPAEKMARVWFVIALIVVYFYALPFFVLWTLLARYVPQGKPALAVGWIILATVKLLGISAFLRFMMLQEPTQFVQRDTIDQVVVWFLVAVMGAFCFIFYRSRSAPRT